MLVGNLSSRIRTFSYNVDFNEGRNLSNDHNGNNIITSNYESLINDNSAIQLDSVKSVLKHFSLNHLIIHWHTNAIRNKFDIMKTNANG